MILRNLKLNVIYIFVAANKMAREMLENKNKSNGLVKKMVDENIKNEDIIRIITDFIMAAGDTVSS